MSSKSVHDEKDYQAIRSALTTEFNRLRETYEAPPFVPTSR